MEWNERGSPSLAEGGGGGGGKQCVTLPRKRQSNRRVTPNESASADNNGNGGNNVRIIVRPRPTYGRGIQFKLNVFVRCSVTLLLYSRHYDATTRIFHGRIVTENVNP